MKKLSLFLEITKETMEIPDEKQIHITFQIKENLKKGVSL